MSFPSSLIHDDIRSLFKRKKNQFFFVSGLIAGLLFILNIFLIFSLYTQEFSSGIKEKLGMYFYIVDTTDQDGTIYSQVMQLSKKLEQYGMETVFSSKDESFGFLENKIPHIVENFQKFGISNPLPATLYVMFHNDQQYQALKSTIGDYKHIIVNSTDLDQISLQDQENRVVTMIHFSRFVTVISGLLVFFLFAVILTLCAYMLHGLYIDFHGKILVKKLLGSSFHQTIRPFVLMTVFVMGYAYLLALALLLLSGFVASWYLHNLFGVTVWDIVVSYGMGFWAIVFVQLLCMISGTVALSYLYVKHLIYND